MYGSKLFAVIAKTSSIRMLTDGATRRLQVIGLHSLDHDFSSTKRIT